MTITTVCTKCHTSQSCAYVEVLGWVCANCLFSAVESREVLVVGSEGEKWCENCGDDQAEICLGCAEVTCYDCGESIDGAYCSYHMPSSSCANCGVEATDTALFCSRGCGQANGAEGFDNACDNCETDAELVYCEECARELWGLVDTDTLLPMTARAEVTTQDDGSIKVGDVEVRWD